MTTTPVTIVDEPTYDELLIDGNDDNDDDYTVTSINATADSETNDSNTHLSRSSGRPPIRQEEQPPPPPPLKPRSTRRRRSCCCICGVITGCIFMVHLSLLAIVVVTMMVGIRVISVETPVTFPIITITDTERQHVIDQVHTFVTAAITTTTNNNNSSNAMMMMKNETTANKTTHLSRRENSVDHLNGSNDTNTTATQQIDDLILTYRFLNGHLVTHYLAEYLREHVHVILKRNEIIVQTSVPTFPLGGHRYFVSTTNISITTVTGINTNNSSSFIAVLSFDLGRKLPFQWFGHYDGPIIVYELLFRRTTTTTTTTTTNRYDDEWTTTLHRMNLLGREIAAIPIPIEFNYNLLYFLTSNDDQIYDSLMLLAAAQTVVKGIGSIDIERDQMIIRARSNYFNSSRNDNKRIPTIVSTNSTSLQTKTAPAIKFVVNLTATGHGNNGDARVPVVNRDEL